MTKVEKVLSIGTFSEWTVLMKSSNRCRSRGFPFVVCRCSCGTVKDVRSRDLLNGSSKSCGCRSLDKVRSRDGDTNHRLFNTWSMMRVRCNDPKKSAYKYYGCVGIKVCGKWDDPVDGFRNFLEDMESTYKEGLTLDRINSKGGYCKDNCHWATKKQQANNCKSNSLLEVQGLVMTCAEWAGLIGLTTSSLNSKVRREGVNCIDFDFELPAPKVVYHYKGEVMKTLSELIDRVVRDDPSATRHSYRSDNSTYMDKHNIRIEPLDDRRTLEEVYKYLITEDFDPDWVPEDSLYIKSKYKYYLKENV